jgi:hypothetical protein
MQRPKFSCSLAQLAIAITCGLTQACATPELQPATTVGGRGTQRPSEPVGGLPQRVTTIEPGHQTAWAPFPFRLTRYLGNCAFSGSVKQVAARLLERPDAELPAALLQDAHFTVVRLPERLGDPLTVDIEWPVVGRYYLDSPAAVRNSTKVTLVRDHLTVPPYTAFHRLTASGETATMHVQLGKKSYRQSIPCRELTLENKVWG